MADGKYMPRIMAGVNRALADAMPGIPEELRRAALRYWLLKDMQVPPSLPALRATDIAKLNAQWELDAP